MLNSASFVSRTTLTATEAPTAVLEADTSPLAVDFESVLAVEITSTSPLDRTVDWLPK